MSECRLDEICNIYDCPHYTAENEGKGYALIRTPNVGRGRLIMSDVHRVSFENYKKRNARATPECGDLIFAREAPAGNIAVIQNGEAVCLGQRTVLLKPNPKIVNAYYLAYNILTPWQQRRLLAPSAGSIVSHVNLKDIKAFTLTLPTIEQQKIIAQVLCALDDKIELNRRLNDNLEAMAQALYDYWFVQFDFPDENGRPYKTSGGKMVWNEVLKREIPAGWSCGQLGDIIQANPTEHLNKGAVAPYIAMEALSTTRFLTDEPEKKPYAGGMKFRNKDILIARITPCLENGKTALVHDLKDKEVGFGSTEYIVIRGKLFSLPTFCICLARSKAFRSYAISKMTGTSGRRRLDYKDVEAYKLPIPPVSLLCKFENWGTGVLDKMHKTHVQNRILEKQRDFLLPLLMNGQVQVRPQGVLNYRLYPLLVA